MGRFWKILLWAAGFVILAFLIQYPIQQTDTTWERWSLPLSGKTIVIDPGHGGPDGGAVGEDETLEKDIALAVARKMRDYLQQSGALVYLTREEDTDLASDDTKGLSRRKAEDIRQRLQFIHDQEADFFVTLHLNALSSEKWHGAQTFYHPKEGKSKHLAEMIQDEVTRNLKNTSRESLSLDNVYLLKHAEVPGALVEIGFLSNEPEREQLKDDEYQRKMAGSIYEGILRYATEEPDE
ncbi:N-acetylmuramoyl-L-alanine amidase CwlD [Lentibacillus amyloliquefaciens]|uniref:N-acetylmuramoyl-L-alanine amidase n=1 Tax=Lentibacillus amyloliquefaciens TaxID=1472767 RepID=A0A0U4G9D3_9BACI|nr:N-acetylmuramoyl-L-alanine amidase CwlD [Lentibacillus amyloliquefaciens]ALX49354.1 N-acetylmuramoyl-L-alanine amidase [Lentibacillus amyloliquefaciens]